MVKRHQPHPHLAVTNPGEFNTWLQHVKAIRSESDIHLLQTAYDLNASILNEQDREYCLTQGLAMAIILLELDIDSESLAAALVQPAIEQDELSLDLVAEKLGESTAKLLRGVRQMSALNTLLSDSAKPHAQLENLRKMLLAMVDDVRAVLIKLAERLYLLRNAKQLSPTQRQQFAKETMDVYAPLANRLGIGQLKWEMEDLCFRYLEPQEYKKIASFLDQRRVDREQYIHDVIAELKSAVQASGIHKAEVNGRVKHIYSIYRKMTRKGVDYSQIYDVSAVRVLVPTIEDCYGVLGLVHGLWEQIPQEFDDYITYPKPNGYRSIHTAVVGPHHKNVEVQIRTFDMHQESELGVAAHWRYKEGGQQKSAYEAKIAWLRQVLEWQKEIANAAHLTTAKTQEDIFADHVYVFTPTDDIVELQSGATPLDFAYHIHSEVGHRCRGAKVDGNIVPITYALQTGQRVEILTAKQANPSRDWLNPHLGYLKTARARAKVAHWFKIQDYDRNAEAGKELIEKELKRLGIQSPHLLEIAKELNLKSEPDLFAALGSGDIRIGQVLHHIQSKMAIVETPEKIIAPTHPVEKKSPQAIEIQGVGNLLTHIARCCKPLPGESIVGFITQGRGVTIHRSDCSTMLQATEKFKDRLVNVQWGKSQKENYPVDIYVRAFDRHGLLRDITALLSTEKINLSALQTYTDKTNHEAHIYLIIDIPTLTMLSKILDRIQHLPNVIKASRRVEGGH